MTNNLERRINEHKIGIDPKCYTFNKRPVAIVYSVEFGDVNQAIENEKRIKKWSRKKKEALINGEFDKLKLLSQKEF